MVGQTEGDGGFLERASSRGTPHPGVLARRSGINQSAYYVSKMSVTEAWARGIGPSPVFAAFFYLLPFTEDTCEAPSQDRTSRYPYEDTKRLVHYEDRKGLCSGHRERGGGAHKGQGKAAAFEELLKPGTAFPPR